MPTFDIPLAFFALEDQEMIRQAIERAHQDREVIDIEVPAFFGTVKKVVRIRGCRVDDIPGISLLGTVQVISKLKNLMSVKALTDSLYKSTGESAKEAIVSTDESLFIVSWHGFHCGDP